MTTDQGPPGDHPWVPSPAITAAHLSNPTPEGESHRNISLMTSQNHAATGHQSLDWQHCWRGCDSSINPWRGLSMVHASFSSKKGIFEMLLWQGSFCVTMSMQGLSLCQGQHLSLHQGQNLLLQQMPGLFTHQCYLLNSSFNAFTFRHAT